MKNKSIKYIKKLLSALLAAAMLLCAASTGASAKDNAELLYYNISEGKLWITGCDQSASGKLTIPSEIDGYPVNYIDEYAFYNCTNLTSIIIPDSVTHIHSGAFKNCTALTNITIGNGVTTIKGNPFNGTGYYNDNSNWEDGVSQS